MFRVLYAVWLLSLAVLMVVTYQWMWWASMFFLLGLFGSLVPLLDVWHERRSRA